MINYTLDNIYKLYYGQQPIKIAYLKDKLIYANGLLLSFNWRLVESFTVNDKEYRIPATGVVFPKKTKITWSCKPLRYCHLDITEGEFILEDHAIIGSEGYVDPLPLNIVFCDKENKDIIFTNSITNHIDDVYNIIGIEIIPKSHDVYNNNSSGIIGVEACLGRFDDNDEQWSWIEERGKVGYGSSAKANKITASNGDVIFPTTMEGPTMTVQGVNPNEYYTNDRSNWAPSPYNPDGTRNSVYYQNTNNNCLQYFDGKEQTKKIWEHVGNKATVVEKVLNYKTIDTNIGDWYVPSTGEFGYAVARWQEYIDISNILKTLYMSLKLGSRTEGFFTSNYWGFRNATTGYQMSRFTITTGYHTKSSKTEEKWVAPFIQMKDDNSRKVILDWYGVKSYTINGTTYYANTKELILLKDTDIEWSCVLKNGYEAQNPIKGEFTLVMNTTLTPNTELIGTDMPVVLVDKLTEEKFYTYYPNTYSSERYEPIGVVVIPKEHDVYGTGEVGVVAIRYASAVTPDEGTTIYEQMPFGGYGLNTTIPDYTYANCYDSPVLQDTLSSRSLTESDYATLPGQPADFGIQCISDPEAYYSTSYADYNLPSPYNPDGSRNEDYYTLKYNTLNAFGYFCGKENTEVLWDLATWQTDWRTDDEIIYDIPHNSTQNYSDCYPVACVVWRFSTLGTNQGDWFIPSAGECGYLSVRKDYINNTIARITEMFGLTPLDNAYTASWTSTEISATHQLNLGFSTGRANAVIKTNITSSGAIPFTKMLIEEKGKAK